MTEPVSALFDMIRRKDEAYEERNRVVALLAHLLPAWKCKTDIPGWDAEWHNCVYILLPNGQQLSWHYHDSHIHLFWHVPMGQNNYDGHTTPEKYRRIEHYITHCGGTNALYRKHSTEAHG